MKKFIAVVIALVAVIAIAVPFSMGFVVQRAFDAEKINAELSKLMGGAPSPLEIRLKSYEKGLFGAKSVVAFAFEGRDALIVESDMSFGWHPSGAFPFVSLVKSRDRLRLSDELLKDAKNELPEPFIDGVFLEGDSLFTPSLSFSGVYASREFNYKEHNNLAVIKPITLKIDTNGKNDAHFALDLPRWEVAEGNRFSLVLEEISAKIDGNLFSYVGDANAEIAIKTIASKNRADKVNIDNLSLKSVQKAKGGTLESSMTLAADAISVVTDEKTINAGKPSLTLASTGLDVKATEDIQRKLQDIQSKQAENPMAAMEEVFKLIDDIVALFDKGAVFSVKIESEFDNAAINFNASLKTDPSVALPKFSMSSDYAEALSAKLIIDAELSAHQAALTALGAPEEGLQMAAISGFVEEDGDVWKTDAHFKNNQWVINGQELPFKGLFPSNESSSRDSYDYDEDYGEGDYDEEYDEEE
jgi:uncharacterized protein YdgA (DUF945 family)